MNDVLAVADASSANGMNRYRTRERAAIPQRVFLRDPGTGEQTEDYLDIVSSLSDTFRLASDKAVQAAGELTVVDDADEKKRKLGELTRTMQASLVVAWSFPEECTQEAVAQFIYECPQVGMLVAAVADKAELFFGAASPA